MKSYPAVFLSIILVHFTVLRLTVTGHPVRRKCRTNPNGFNRLVCDNITDLETLTDSLRQASVNNLQEVSVRYSNLDSVPIALIDFLGFLFLNLRSVSVNTLFDHVVVGPSGLEQLHLDDVSGQTTWSWSPLASLRNLERFSMSNMILPRVNKSLIHYLGPKLQSFSLTSTKTTTIAPEAFTKFRNLVYISIQNNGIEHLERNMFPNPAKIRYFYFGKNRLASLPVDLFNNMPYLRAVGLQDNAISEIKQPTFQIVWRRLPILFLGGNPIKCECQLGWILRQRAPSILTGRCQAPKENYGKPLKSLVKRDFQC